MKLAEIRATYSTDKAAEDGEALQAKYFARPVSYPIAWLFLKLGWSANQVTLLALIFALVGCAFLVVGSYGALLVGSFLLLVRHVLDYADGTMARATKTTTYYGKWLDRTFDDLVEIVVPIATGIGLYNHFHFESWIWLGGFYALAHCLSALSLANMELAYGKQPHGFYKPSMSLWGIVYRIGVNLQSAAVEIRMVASLLNFMPIYFIAYAMLTFNEAVLGIALRMLKND